MENNFLKLQTFFAILSMEQKILHFHTFVLKSQKQKKATFYTKLGNFLYFACLVTIKERK